MVNTARTSSRDRLLAAAAKEFAARGYEGTSVDRIARAARLNKAMIYYHFKNKAGLYRAIVRDAFEAARDAAERVLHTDRPAEEKLRAFVRAIADMASSRPHFPPLWLREFALGARHMDPGTLKVAGAVVAVLAQILREGVEARRFRQANPVAVHIGIVAPIMLFLVSDDARRRLQRAEIRGAAELTFDQIVAHVTESTVGSLQQVEPAPSGE